MMLMSRLGVSEKDARETEHTTRRHTAVLEVPSVLIVANIVLAVAVAVAVVSTSDLPKERRKRKRNDEKKRKAFVRPEQQDAASGGGEKARGCTSVCRHSHRREKGEKGGAIKDAEG